MRSGTLLVLFSAMLWATDAPFRLHLTKELASTFIVLGEHFIDVLFVLPILAYAWPELKKLSIKQWGAEWRVCRPEHGGEEDEEGAGAHGG
jgi:hypothetical protein